MTAAALEIKRSFTTLKSQLEANVCESAPVFAVFAEIDNVLDRLLVEMEEEYAEHPQYWETGAVSLFEAVCECRSLLKVAFVKIDVLVKENGEIRANFERKQELMEAKLKSMEAKLKSMEASKFALMLGQIAYDIDKRVTSKVLDGLVSPEKYVPTVRDMEAAIKGHDHEDVFDEKEEERITAKKRWNFLKTKIGWSGNINRFLGQLKFHRVGIAHPKVDVEYIKQILKDKTVCLPADINTSLVLKLVEIYTLLAHLP